MAQPPSSTGDPAPGTPADRALPALVQRHGARLLSVAERFCGQREEAEDLVQEVFLAAWRAWDSFEGRASPATWLYRIAARACARRHRPRAGEPEQLASLDADLPFGSPRMAVVPGPADSPLEAAALAEAKDRLTRAITELPQTFRMPLVRREIAGLTLAEVAEVLELPEATVKTRLHRARLRLRSALEAVLPRREVPPARFDRDICLDLLTAKQEALDRGLSFRFPDEVVCERCDELFRSLDLTWDLCRQLGSSQLPPGLAEALASRGD